MSVLKSSEQIHTVEYLDILPREWQVSLLGEIRNAVATNARKLVVLDDDPTGTQTVKDLPVLTHWSLEALMAELQGEHPAFFILTNSRSLSENQACGLAMEIGARLQEASVKSGVQLDVVSRSDSTLRGHFPAEVDALATAMGQEGLPYILIPFFQEGGRYTIDDVHYVREDEQLIPAAATPFARDAVFGFKNSNLKAYVAEKTGGRISAEEVMSISLTDIRVDGPAAVAGKIASLKRGQACIINAVSYRDMEVVVAGLLRAERAGKELLYRTAASFVRTRVGIQAGVGLLDSAELVTNSASGGLFVIGSYVEKTSSQIEVLFQQEGITPLQVEVRRLLDAGERDEEVRRIADETAGILNQGGDVAIYTSRELITGNNSLESLEIGGIVSHCLIRIVQEIGVQPRYLVAKGGITSSDIATRALNIQRAMVLGQALPGVPVWKTGEESLYPGMPYIVFPGNVGDRNALAVLQRRLRQCETE